MKLLLIILVLLISILVVPQTYTYYGAWISNPPEENVTHYRLFYWAGTDTTFCPFVEDSQDINDDFLLRTVAHIDNTTYGEALVPEIQDNRYAVIKINAVNQWGRSLSAVSSPYLMSPIPSDPTGVGIVKL